MTLACALRCEGFIDDSCGHLQRGWHSICLCGCAHRVSRLFDAVQRGSLDTCGLRAGEELSSGWRRFDAGGVEEHGEEVSF